MYGFFSTCWTCATCGPEMENATMAGPFYVNISTLQTNLWNVSNFWGNFGKNGPIFEKKWPEFCGLVLTENVVACPVSKVPHAESGLWHVKKKSYTNEISSVPVLQCPSGLVLQCSNDPVLQSVEAWASRLTSRSCLIGIRLASHSIFLAGWLKLKVLFYWLQFKNSTTIFSHIF